MAKVVTVKIGEDNPVNFGPVTVGWIRDNKELWERAKKLGGPEEEMLDIAPFLTYSCLDQLDDKWWEGLTVEDFVACQKGALEANGYVFKPTDGATPGEAPQV